MNYFNCLKSFLEYITIAFDHTIAVLSKNVQLILDGLPDIEEGPFVPRPDPISPGDKMVQIGTTAYVIDGNDLTIQCNIASGTRPITISWLKNRVEDTSFGNVSTITISNVNDGDIYMCRAENMIGFDEEATMIVFQRKWYVYCFGDSLLQ